MVCSKYCQVTYVCLLLFQVELPRRGGGDGAEADDPDDDMDVDEDTQAADGTGQEGRQKQGGHDRPGDLVAVVLAQLHTL